jgi:Fur family peroxide stress response transcriptional regulator
LAHEIETAQVERELERFTRACREQGVPVTHQRLAVYRALLESQEHPDADAIHQSLESQFPTLSLGTVYKTLEMLERQGLIREVAAPGPTRRFEAPWHPHHHLWCVRCRRITDLVDPALNGLTLPPGLDFELTGYTIQFNGVCAACRSAVPDDKESPT